MRLFVRTFVTLSTLVILSGGSNAKVFDYQHIPKNINQLRNGDSFSVECRNNQTGVIDRETVDVDAASVIVEIAGSAPDVHHITKFGITGGEVQDRFGQPGLELHVVFADWGQIGASGVGLLFSGDRWYSHHEDNTWWTCAD